ncbi:MAG TPA: HAD family hydrolase [Anaerolineae bacterium]|nr:HAD family hydrolase [Anaerolineae bacterium]
MLTKKMIQYMGDVGATNSGKQTLAEGMAERRLRNVEAVLFDFGGTLYDVHPAPLRAWQRLLAAAGLNRFRLSDYYQAVANARVRFLDRRTAELVASGRSPSMTAADWTRYNRQILLDLGLPRAELSDDLCQQLGEAMVLARKRYRLLPGARDVVRHLARGLKLGLVSNTSEDLRAYLMNDGIIQCFDVITLSHEVTYWKPDPRIFLHSCLALNTIPSRTAYVGDLPVCDCKAAQEAGLLPILIKRPGVHLPACAGLGSIPTISAIAELTALVEAEHA